MAYASPQGFFNRGEVGSAGYRPLPRRRRSPLAGALAHLGGLAPPPAPFAPSAPLAPIQQPATPAAPLIPLQSPPDQGQQEQALARFRGASPIFAPQKE